MLWRHEKCYVCLSKFNAKKARIFPFYCDHSICNNCFKSWCKYSLDKNKIKCGLCKSKLKKKSIVSTDIMTVKISNNDSISLFYCEGNEWKYNIQDYFLSYKNFLKLEMQDHVQKYIIEAQFRK